MKKKLFILFSLLITTWMLQAQNKSTMQNKSYSTLWEKVAVMEKQSLPKSAAEVVSQIMKQAVADKNSPQIIKALIHQGKYNLAVDTENDTIIFHNLNSILKSSEDVVEKAVINSMLAELYLLYYEKDIWAIDQRTQLANYLPNNMKEWTRNNFFEKIVEHTHSSLSAQKELEKVEVKSYADIVTIGKDSHKFYPSMFDFLALRAINILKQIDSDYDLSRSLAKAGIEKKALFAPADEFVQLTIHPEPAAYDLHLLVAYQKLLSSLQQRNLNKSVVLVEISKINYLQRFNIAYKMYAFDALKKMLNHWKNEDFSVEIINEMTRFYTSIDDNQYMSEEKEIKNNPKIKELYSLLQNTIATFPNYTRINLLKNELNDITQPTFTVDAHRSFTPSNKKKFDIKYRNIRQLKAKLYKVNSIFLNHSRYYSVNPLQTGKETFIKDIIIPLKENEPYAYDKVSFEIPINERGAYKLTFETDKQMDKRSIDDFYFSVTDLASFARSSSENSYEFFVVDRTTGEPATDAKINIYSINRGRGGTPSLLKTIPVDEMGRAKFSNPSRKREIYYQAVLGNDNGLPLTAIPYSYYQYSQANNNQAVETINTFTDRSLYRPGQVVYFKTIVSSSKNDKHNAVINKKITFTLRDANHQNIAEQTLTTNEFGAASGEFILPQGLLTGSFSIEAKGHYTYFQVEEYKRPTFEVTFDKIEKTYKFGEEVTLVGNVKSFSGINLQNVEVAYTITRRKTWWWRGGAIEHFAEGFSTTDNKGEFEIKFTPELADTDNGGVYSFNIEVVVTDQNGEMQVATNTVTVGTTSMVLSLRMPNKIEKDALDEIKIEAKNLDGNDIKAKGTYQLFVLNDNDSIQQSINEGVFEAGVQPELKEVLRKLPSGKYRITLKANDDNGNPVDAKKDFLLFSYADKRPPIKTNEWLVVKSNIFSKTKPAEVILGVSDKNVYILYELWQTNKLLKREWIKLNQENRLFSFPYKQAYAEGATLLLTYVKDDQFYTHNIDIVPEEEKKDLNIKLAVFRDKILPGSKEEWCISVSDAKQQPILAEVLASMYDYSLHNITPTRQWSLKTPTNRRYVPTPIISRDLSFGEKSISNYASLAHLKYSNFEFDVFNWFGFSFYHNIVVRSYAERENIPAYIECLSTQKESVESTEIKKKDTSKLFSEDAVLTEPIVFGGGEKPEKTAPQIRKNFNETAFFYPHLRTNEKGETVIAFTVPESNTKWHFRLLAHDKQMNSATAEAFAISQKKLMVTPNMPRFLREGDKTSISTKISNLSDEALSASVNITFFNPITDEEITTINVANRTQQVKLAKDGSSSVAWSFVVPDDSDVLGVRIVAQSNLFSDGEQHALAVLPNRMLVTESMRMDVNYNQTKDFTFEQLVNQSSTTLQNYRLTLEFASNPAWYAVQALPVLSTPDNDNAVSWFAAYYANTLGLHIGNQYPKVKAMIDAWQKQGGNAETLRSNLEKNQELKNVLLEETPWVLATQSEAEQKQKLSLLFDINRTNMISRDAIDKLKELQDNSGGWSWVKGFRPNISVTQYILYGFNQLHQLKATNFTDDIRRMQAKAISYIDTEALQRFKHWKKNNKEWRKTKTITTHQLEYLYVRSLYSQYPMSNEIKKMNDFYLAVIENNWTKFTLYQRSLIAILMHEQGKQQVMSDIIKSYREHATINDEMGMYWANNRASVFMSQSAVSVHTFIMEAFRMAGAKDQEMDNMKRWLLKQKQTQQWESVHATVDAVYTLLNTGSDWFTSNGKVAITIGENPIRLDNKALGNGYFKESWTQSEIEPTMGNVTVTQKGNSPAWGALYWQYFEDLDKIDEASATLNVKKEFFKEQTGESGKQLVQITESSPLKVGDKVVVRLAVQTDRDLEFVHLKDMRAVAFEPENQLSGIEWKEGVIYYQTAKDASTNYYFDVLPRGFYIFEYNLFATRSGSYSNGITTIQCMYAPEFTSHTKGIRINVKE